MILVDEAPSSSSLLAYPPLSEGLGVKSRLPSPPWSETRADAAFFGNGPQNQTLKVGLEVKKITELAGALKTGRLQATQIPGLLELYDVCWLLVITGSHRRGPNGELQILRTLPTQGQGGGLHAPGPRQKVWINYQIGQETIRYSYVHKFLSSPSFTSTGIRAWAVYDEREAAAWIGDLYETWQKPYSSHSSMRVVDRSGLALEGRAAMLHNPKLQDPRFSQKVKTAAALPNIGYERAVAMAEAFGSAQEILSPACQCREREEEMERERKGAGEEARRERERLEEERWGEVRTVDAGTGKSRRIGKSIAKQIGELVR